MSLEHDPSRSESSAASGMDGSPYWDSFIDEKAGADFLGLTPRTMQGYRQKGGGPRYAALSSRCLRYTRRWLREWAETRIRSSTSDPGQAGADEGRDLISVRDLSDSELNLARILLRVIAEMAQQDPDIQPHTVKTVFDMISHGIEELWLYHPSEWEIGDGPPTIEPVPTDPAPTVEQQDPDDPVADDDPLAIPECFRREKTA